MPLLVEMCQLLGNSLKIEILSKLETNKTKIPKTKVVHNCYLGFSIFGFLTKKIAIS